MGKLFVHFSLILFILSSPFVDSNLQAQSLPCTLFVSTSGSDANDGRSESGAFKTIQQAANTASPGDVVCVRAGTYAGFHIAGKQGASDAWIVFKPYPGEEGKVVIDSYEPYRISGITQDTLLRDIEISGSSYIEINGFEMTCSNPLYDSDDPQEYRKGVGNEAIKWNSPYGSYGPVHHIRIVNNHIYRIGGNGFLGMGHDVVIAQNRFHDIGLNRLGYGMYIGGSDHVIRGNEIRDAYGYGIHLYSGSGEPPTRILIENNVLANNGRSDFARGWNWRTCEASGCPYGDGIVDWGGSDNIIRNNIVYGSRMAGMTIHSMNDVVVNNTSYGNLGPSIEQPGIWVTEGKNAIIRNNVSFGNQGGDAYVGDGNIEDHNLFSVDPEFVDAANGDFHLGPTSPAIDAGTFQDAPSTDFEGTPRPQGAAFDIGAYEYKFGQEDDTTPPTVPKGLTGTVISSSRIDLSWTASTDNVGVTGYIIYRNGKQVATTVETSYQSTGLRAFTSYTHRVVAYDGAGNRSAQSAAVTRTTQPVPSTKFKFGDRVKTIEKANVRSEPTGSGTVLGTQPRGAQGVVVGGPWYWNQRWWWEIDFDNGSDGWVAQGKLKTAVP